MPLVSVIVPVYNGQKYIERCLNSIKNQTFNDFEVIIVDDGSVDGTAATCKHYSRVDNRFFYFYQENSGPDMARKTGTCNASGKFIMYVDADDYVSEDILKDLIEIKEKHDADIVCSSVVRFNDSGKQWQDNEELYDICSYEGEQDILLGYFSKKRIIGSYYAKLINTDIMKNYEFVPNSVIGEDITAVLYMLSVAHKVIVIPNKDYYYYWNTNSISHSGYTDRHFVSLKNYIRVRDAILKQDIIDNRLVCGYFAEFEMAVATAMSRNLLYNKEAANLLHSDIKKYWKLISRNKDTALYMKLCMLIYLASPKLFIYMYRLVYLLTGR